MRVIKTGLFSLLFSLLSTACFAQVSDSLLHQMIMHLWRHDSSHYVIRTCNSYLNQNRSKRDKIEAMYYKAWAYENLHMNDSATYFFETVFTIPHNKRDKDFHDEIDDDNNKNEAARKLAGIFIVKTEYDSAFKYLDMARDKFEYFSWGPLENYIYFTWDLAMKYSECYKGQHQYKKAIQELEHYVMNSIFTSGNTDWMMDTLYSYYLLMHSKEDVEKEFINAVGTVQVESKRFTRDTGTYTVATVRIYGDTIEFYQPMDFDIPTMNEPEHKKTQAETKQECIKVYMDIYLYRLATGKDHLRSK